jgi:hypothetical protein
VAGGGAGGAAAVAEGPLVAVDLAVAVARCPAVEVHHHPGHGHGRGDGVVGGRRAQGGAWRAGRAAGATAPAGGEQQAEPEGQGKPAEVRRGPARAGAAAMSRRAAVAVCPRHRVAALAHVRPACPCPFDRCAAGSRCPAVTAARHRQIGRRRRFGCSTTIGDCDVRPASRCPCASPTGPGPGRRCRA